MERREEGGKKVCDFFGPKSTKSTTSFFYEQRKKPCPKYSEFYLFLLEN
jgi:hypothetical protein